VSAAPAGGHTTCCKLLFLFTYSHDTQLVVTSSEWQCVAGVECCRQVNISETSHQQRTGPVKSGGHTRRLRTAYTNTQVRLVSHIVNYSSVGLLLKLLNAAVFSHKMEYTQRSALDSLSVVVVSVLRRPSWCLSKAYFYQQS